jgi:protein gp37
MAARTSIEWTEMTWNPVTGCTKVSPGCKFCYAERMANRLRAIGIPQYRNGFKVTLAPQVLNDPFTWSKPRRVFVNSMSDLFHEEIPYEYLARVFSVMQSTPHHTYQVLTKRSARLAQLATSLHWPDNVWMGVTIESSNVLSRTEHLRRCDASVRFLSLEPLIGPVPGLNLKDIDWVIVGGESGPRGRPIEKAWVDQIRLVCRSQRVPFFFKQWGKAEFNPDPHDPTLHKSHPQYAKGGCQLAGEIVREFPKKGLQYRSG